MKLSVILISYDMAREIPRTLQSLSRGYQQGALDLAYEVLLVDNGSPEPLNEATWADVDVPVRLIRVQDASPSPAGAINIALQEAQGDVICLMIDGEIEDGEGHRDRILLLLLLKEDIIF